MLNFDRIYFVKVIYSRVITRDGTRPEEPYSIHLNSNGTRAPPWPKAQLNNKMFILPKKLDFHDKIVVEGVTFDQRRQLKIGLLTGCENPDPYNVACQLDIDFKNKIAIQVIQNGQINVISKDLNARDFFSDSQSFHITFIVRTKEIVDVYVKSSFMADVKLNHNIEDIRFLNVQGDFKKVTRLDFQFGHKTPKLSKGIIKFSD